jgi:phage tail sheath protein FI
MAITEQTFPGVYAKVVDNSFLTQTSSRFHAGIIGVAEKGPFDTPVLVRTLKDFRRVFGRSLDNRYMANAVAMLANLSDGTVCVRVGRRYEPAVTDGSGSRDQTTITTQNSAYVDQNSFLRIRSPGKRTTVGVKVQSKSGNELTLDKPLEDDYSGAHIDTCPIGGDDETNAANEAESFLYTYQYGEAVKVTGNTAVDIKVVGEKNKFEFFYYTPDQNANGEEIVVGDLLKLEQEGRYTTREVLVKDVKGPVKKTIDGTDYNEFKVLLHTANDAELGYQALPLQDSYDDAKAYKVVKNPQNAPETSLCAHLLAASAGTWANSDGARTGLIVKVAPGSKPDTKKLLVYENSALVETIDNLSVDANSPDYYVTRIQGRSSYITIFPGFTINAHPANTVDPWNLSAAKKINVAAFEKGANGLTPSAQDFVGTVKPEDDSQTGLKVFDDENLTVDVIVAPDISTLFSTDYMTIAQEMDRICRKIFAVGLLDVPRGLNAREAIDWHNGEKMYAWGSGNQRYSVKLDTRNLALWWNWLLIADPFTGEKKFVPPTLGVLRCLAETFDHYKPWYAAAGELRGVIPEALAVEYAKVAPETRMAMYGNGNSVNPILVIRNRIMNFGERTLQRAESKLTAFHNVVLTNYILRNLSEIGRRFVFDPNDQELLDQLKLAIRSFMDSVKNDRGVEEYLLVLDETNNTAETRNRREVIVDLSYIPTDAVERIYINATVRESGAELNSIR